MKNKLLLASLLLGGTTVSAQNVNDAKLNPKAKQFDLTAASFSTSQSAVVLKQSLKMSASDEMKQLRSFTDQMGFTHEKFQQFHKGVKVEYATYTVHGRSGVIKRMNGEAYEIEGVNTQPTLSESAALEAAKRFVGAKSYVWEAATSLVSGKDGEKPAGELVIVPNYLNKEKGSYKKPHLAYKFNIYASQPVSRAFIYVDAHTGEIVHENDIIHHAVATGTAATRYSGSRSIQTDSYNGSFRLRDSSRGNGIETYDCNTGTNYGSAVDFTDNNNNWTAAEHDNAQKDNAALDAHWGAQVTYDYWMQIHNRNSFDGNGAAIKSYVHYDSNYDNAFWNGSVMTYGDGSGTNFDALTSLDVAGHEIGHAICTNTANLVYQNESGAMNEGFSDIWAACIEHFAMPEKGADIWIIGEDIERRAGKQGLRSMSDPESEGQPDTYKGSQWYSGTGDNGGVHYNSGVLNHWFFRLSEGGSGTSEAGYAYNFSGIGIADAAKIAYRLESVYLSANSVYADASTYGIQSAIDIFGANSAQHLATIEAFRVVGLGPVPPVEACDGNVTLSLTTDQYASEVSWTLKNASGTTVESGSGYANNTTYTLNWTLAAGDYTFAIADSYGDGLLSPGGYSLKDGCNTTMKSGASYGSGESVPFTVVSSTPVNNAPVASVGGPYGAEEGVSISFNASGSSDADGDALSYSWSFGDGSNGTGVSPSHTYASAGTYTVTVTVGDGTDSDNASTTATITAAPPVGGVDCSSTVSLPYSESFEGGFGAWTQGSGDDFNWATRSGTTPSSNTGPSSASAGSTYAYVEASSPNYAAKTTILEGPCFNLASASAANFSFDYHMYGASNMGSLTVEADNGSGWSSVWTLSGNQGNAWANASVDLAAYVGSTVKLRFVGVTGSTWQGDMAVDNLSASAGNGGGGTGGTTTQVTLALTFDDYASETSWSLLDASGATLASGSGYSNTQKGTTITETFTLPAGCYDFVINDSYGDGICCTYGNGSYVLTSGGSTLASGGSFASTETKSICVGQTIIAGVATGVNTGSAKASIQHAPEFDIVVYPNPVTGASFNIAIPSSMIEAKISVYNAAGQVVFTDTVDGDQTISIDAQRFTKGMYFVKTQSGTDVSMKKLIVR